MPNPGDSAAKIKSERSRIYARSDLSDSEKAQEYAIYSSVLRRKKRKGAASSFPVVRRGSPGYDRGDRAQQENRYAEAGQVGRMLERHYRHLRPKKGADYIQGADDAQHLTVVGLQRPMKKEQMLAALWIRLAALRAAWEERKHPRDEIGRFVEVEREAYESEMRGPGSEASRTVAYAVQRGEEAAEPIQGAVDEFWSEAKTTVLEEDEDEGDWTALDEVQHRLRQAGIAGRVDSERLTDVLRGGVFSGGGVVPPAVLRDIWDLMEEIVGGSAVEAARAALGRAAEDADEDAQRDYEQAETIGRGMSLAELRNMSAQGVVQQVNSDGRDFASFTSVPAIAIEYADKRAEGGPGALVEFDGEAVRSSGAARIPEYHYISRDGQGHETFESDIPLGVAGQREVRIKAGTSVASLRPRRVTFMGRPSREDVEAARKLVGDKGIVQALSGAVRRTDSLRGRLSILKAAWDERKHPRGQPGNPGQFAEVEGGGEGRSKDAEKKDERAFAPITPDVFGKADSDSWRMRDARTRAVEDIAQAYWDPQAYKIWRTYRDRAQAVASERRSLEKSPAFLKYALEDFEGERQRLLVLKRPLTRQEFAGLDGRWQVARAWREWIDTASAARKERYGVDDQLLLRPFAKGEYDKPDGQKIMISGAVINREADHRDTTTGERIRWNAVNWRRAWNSLPGYLKKNVKIVALSASLKHPSVGDLFGQYTSRDDRITMNASERLGEHSYARVRALAIHEAQHARWMRGRTQEQRDGWKLRCMKLEPIDSYMELWHGLARQATRAVQAHSARSSDPEDLAREGSTPADYKSKQDFLELEADKAWELYANEMHSRVGEWELEWKGSWEGRGKATSEEPLIALREAYRQFFPGDFDE